MKEKADCMICIFEWHCDWSRIKDGQCDRFEEDPISEKDNRVFNRGTHGTDADDRKS